MSPADAATPEGGDDPGLAAPVRDGPALAAQWARTLMAMGDPHIRLRRIASLLQKEGPEVLAHVLQAAAQGSVTSDLRSLYVALAHWVLHARPRPRFPVGHWPVPADELAPPGAAVALAIAEARRSDFAFAEMVLRGAFAWPTPADQALPQLHPSVDKLALGVRRERARGTDQNQLQFLLLDTTPAVVQILADNPRVTEVLAVQIASLRSQTAYALQALVMVPRWLGNERVVEAVVRNPNAAPWLALLLAPLLPRRTQLAVTHLEWLDRSVREVLAHWHGETTTAPKQPDGYLGIFELDTGLESAGDPAEALHQLLADRPKQAGVASELAGVIPERLPAGAPSPSEPAGNDS